MQKYEVHELPYDVKSLQRLAEAQGWECQKTSGGHHKWISPEGKIVGHSGTPSDHRAIKNFRAELKRYGLRPYTPLKEDKQLNEPKLVVSKVEGDSTIPIGAVGAGAPVTAEVPSGRGELKALVMAQLIKLVRPEGVGAREILDTLKTRFPTMDINRLSTSLASYVKTGDAIRVSQGRYLAVLKKEDSKPVGRTKPQDDMAVLDEVLASMAKLETVVRRMKEQMEAFNRIKEAMAAIK